MRRFTDGNGRRWDVVAGRESWGAVFAIFVPYDAPGGETPESGSADGVRQTPLTGSSYAEATTELDALSEEELRAMLERSDPKNPG